MRLWEVLEEHLYDNDLDGASFSALALAADMDIDGGEASAMIQSYLRAQTSAKPKTLFVLTRTGRTKTAVWHVGARSLDARRVSKQTSDDIKHRLEEFYEPTLRRMAERNPRALPTVNALTKAFDATVELMVALMDDA